MYLSKHLVSDILRKTIQDTKVSKMPLGINEDVQF